MKLQYRQPFQNLPPEALTDPSLRHIFRHPLEDFKSAFPLDERWKEYYERLLGQYKAYRPCQSAGNSLLKAFGFGLLEYLVRHKEKPEDFFSSTLQSISDEEDVFQHRQDYEEQASMFCDAVTHLLALNLQNPELTMFRLQYLFNCSWFTAIFCKFIRMVTLNYIDLHADDEQAEFDMLQKTPEELAQEVEGDKELDELTLLIICKAFKVTAVVMNLEGRYGEDNMYLGEQQRDLISLYRLKSEFGVLYAQEHLQTDRKVHNYCSHLATVYDESARDNTQLLFPNYPYTYHGDSKDWKWFCNHGSLQSPIDLTHAKEIPSRSYKHNTIQIAYNKCVASGYFNPHTFIIIKNFGTLSLVNHLKVPIKTYDAMQFHFHAPSEHAVDGRLLAAEMHIFHQNLHNYSELAVLAVLFEEGPANPFLESVINPTGKIDLTQFLQGKTVLEDFYYYFGSVTSPMCDEIVRWFIVKNVQTMSKEQLEFFTSRWAHNPEFAGGRGNNRPLNPRNGRNVILFTKN